MASSRHIIVALLMLIISGGALFFGYSFLDDALSHPELYFSTPIAPEDFARGSVLYLGGLSVFLLVLSGFLVSKVIATHGARRMTRELALSGTELRLLFDQAPLPYLVIRKNGVIEQSNKAALRLFKVSEGDLESREFTFLFPEDVHERLHQVFVKFKQGVPTDQEEIKIVRSDGARRYVSLSIFEMQKFHGSEQTGLVSLFDITEQKELDRAKTQFLSLASHQLRTPLATVKWYTDMLLSNGFGTLSEKQREYIEHLQEANQNMIDLVNLLLNVSRMELGKLEPALEVADVHAISESVLEELRFLAERKRLRVEKHYDEPFRALKTDPKLLRIVIQNLVSNAIKYTPEGGTIRILLDASGGARKVVVADTGYGIPFADREKVFSKMFRADNIKKENVEGTGLGLYLVKSIVDMLGGSIGFTSEVNRGTIFTVTLRN